jgi:hypothetical protein
MKAALLCIHREFQLGNPSNEPVAETESYLVPCVSSPDSRLLDHKL